MRAILLSSLLALSACKDDSATKDPDAAPAPAASDTAAAPAPSVPPSWMTLTSTAFESQGSIPKKHTCEGANVSPALAWTQVPGGTKSLALIVDDPDAPDPRAPKMTWVHWIVYNIPPDVTAIAEGDRKLGGAVQGYNDYRHKRYEGPCPPRGKHRYFFKLYALDIIPRSLQDATKQDLERAMEGHILGKVELMGTYEKGE
jgi:hypothetical protein